MIVIALNGAPRAGKTTFKDFLVKSYGFKDVKIATDFKEYVSNCLGRSMDDLEATKSEPVKFRRKYRSYMTDPTPVPPELTVRDLMIRAADVMEGVDEAFWMSKTTDQIVKDSVNDWGDVKLPRKVVIDSIGKRSQLAWLMMWMESKGLSLNGLIVVRPHRSSEEVDSEDPVFSDGRHRIERSDFSVPINIVEVYNRVDDHDYSSITKFSRSAIKQIQEETSVVFLSTGREAYLK